MTYDTIIANARLILRGDIVTGALAIKDGRIADISQGATVPPGAIDAGGEYLAPGLIELHTDNLERHLTPRPKVHWPRRAAIVAHDRELAGTGITTVYDAIRVGSILTDKGKQMGKHARQTADDILAMRNAGALRIRHHLHLRAELCSETLTDELDEFGPEDRVGIVSMMDHTPGQRQFSDMDKYRAYVCGKHGLDPGRFDEYVAFLGGLQRQNGARHAAATVDAARRYGATLASHDDTTAPQVATSHSHGVRLAEFPTTMEAADTCHAMGISTIMGAPNLVRGGSHSGNVAASDLAAADRLDILSSDYVPAALLQGAVQLGALWGDLARGIATATATPADSLGLADRGQIAIGRNADLIRFAALDDVALLRGVWCGGAQVA